MSVVLLGRFSVCVFIDGGETRMLWKTLDFQLMAVMRVEEEAPWAS